MSDKTQEAIKPLEKALESHNDDCILCAAKDTKIQEALALLRRQPVCETCGGSGKKEYKNPPSLNPKTGEHHTYPCPDCPPQAAGEKIPDSLIERGRKEGVGWNARDKSLHGVTEFWLEHNNEKIAEINKQQYKDMRELIRCFHAWHDKKWEKIAAHLKNLQDAEAEKHRLLVRIRSAEQHLVTGETGIAIERLRQALQGERSRNGLRTDRKGR